MKYLKRLKNELVDLTQKLTARKPGQSEPIQKEYRQMVLQIAIVLVKRAREVDYSSEDWTPESAPMWFTYAQDMKGWLAKMPKAPKVTGKEVENSEAAA